MVIGILLQFYDSIVLDLEGFKDVNLQGSLMQLVMRQFQITKSKWNTMAEAFLMVYIT